MLDDEIIQDILKRHREELLEAKVEDQGLPGQLPPLEFCLEA